MVLGSQWALLDQNYCPVITVLSLVVAAIDAALTLLVFYSPSELSESVSVGLSAECPIACSELLTLHSQPRQRESRSLRL